MESEVDSLKEEFHQRVASLERKVDLRCFSIS